MRAWLIAGVLTSSLAAQAQTPPPAPLHAPDGGVREHLQSIAIPPLTNAPFLAVVTTEWTKILPDGTTATMKNRRTVARDTSGRTFQERKYFSPDGDKQATRISALEYIDPARSEFYSCIPEQKTCYASTFRGPAIAAMPAGANGTQACACATPRQQGMAVQQEALGEKTIEDVQVTGSREIVTIPTGQIGNQKPEPIVKEFWYAPRLGVNLITKRFDPRSGIQNFIVDHINLSEPDPRMFEPPPEYRVMRQVVERQGVPQAKP